MQETVCVPVAGAGGEGLPPPPAQAVVSSPAVVGGVVTAPVAEVPPVKKKRAVPVCRQCLRVGLDRNLHSKQCRDVLAQSSRRLCVDGCEALSLASVCPRASGRGQCYKCGTIGVDSQSGSAGSSDGGSSDGGSSGGIVVAPVSECLRGAVQVRARAKAVCKKCLQIGGDRNLHKPSCLLSGRADRRKCADDCDVYSSAMLCPGRAPRGVCYGCRLPNADDGTSTSGGANSGGHGGARGVWPKRKRV